MSDTASNRKKTTLLSLLKEPTDRPVEDEKSVGWLNITLIKVGVFISLPGFVTGVKVGNAVGFYESIYAFLIAGIILGCLASFCGTVGSKTKLSTYMITQYAFGTRGALLINIIIAISLFGWFGINTALFGSAVLTAVGGAGSEAQIAYSVVGGLLMVATAVFGFKALDKVSQLAVPLLFAGLFILVYVSVSKIGMTKIVAPVPNSMSLGNAISAVVGGSVIGTVIFPDICRYARTFKHGVIAAILTFTVAKPIILMTSAVPSLATGHRDIMEILNSLNLGVMALAIVVFTTWTSNNGNLYGASLSLSTIFKQFKYWQLVLISGTVGTLLAVFGVMEHFIPFLHLLGISIPPVAGIYIVHFYILNGGVYNEQMLRSNPPINLDAIFAWCTACVLAYCTLKGYFSLTTVPAMDALLTAGVSFFVLSKIGFSSIYWKPKNADSSKNDR
ncbi:MAG: cytosine permease [Arenicella sp.]|nr:cytosine permease [Arenicella sp.]